MELLTLRADRVFFDGALRQDLDVVLDQSTGRIVGVVPRGHGLGRAQILSGLDLLPGLIDVHSMERGPQSIDGRDGLNLLAQGVTTIVTGNCGAGYPETSRQYSLPVNVAALLGLNAYLMESVTVATTEEHRHRLEAMLQSTHGGSIGLMYEPARSLDATFLEMFADAIADAAGVLAIHVRDEGAGLQRSIEEVLSLNKKCKSVVMHLKACGESNWHLLDSARASLEAAGIAFTYYPYTDTNTRLAACYPSDHSRLAQEGLQTLARGGWAGVVLTQNCPPQWVGSSVSEVSSQLGCSDLASFEAILSLAPDARVRFRDVAELAGLHLTARSPLAIPASDAYVFGSGDRSAEHPRNWGAIARSVRWSLEGGYVEQTLDALTEGAASLYALGEVGAIREGFYADLVAVNLSAVQDAATYDDPTKAASGVDTVWIGGQVAFSGGNVVNPRLGRLT